MFRFSLHIKTILSRLIEKAPNASLFLIRRKKRSPGGWKGKVKMDSSFDKLPDEFMKHFR